MNIDQSKLNKEITDKYSITNNAFKLDKIKNTELDIYKNEPKDEINVIIGDDKQPDTFLPQVKLQRWSNEVNFSVRLVDEEKGQDTLTTKDDKVKWSKGNIDIDFHDYEEDEGGYKFVWYLKEKPPTNKVEFTIQSKGLDFFYQPPMNEEQLREGQTADETHIYDSEGNIIAERPENVVGSYAVYHSTKGVMVDAYGKDYKTGQAFFIYRPHIIDANGAETWGILHIENGIYSVEIPQDFLDKAVYPIKSNDTFGFTTKGGSYEGYSLNGSYFAAPSSGTVTSMTAYMKNYTSSKNVNLGYYNRNGTAIGTHVAHGTSQNLASTYNNWFSTNVSGSIVNATNYFLIMQIGNANGYDWYYNSGSANQNGYDSGHYLSYNNWNDNPTVTYNTHKLSIYATYTAAASGPANLKSRSGNLNANIKSMSGNILSNIKSLSGNS